MKTQLLIVALMGALFVCSAIAKEENHVGYSLIKNLQTEALNIINELDDQWKVQSGLLQKGISSWENTVNQQTTLCDSRSGDLGKTNKEIQNTEGYIAWIQNKIAQNEARVQTLLEWRCTANTLYINGIKNNKLTLSLIEYLYRELSSAKNLEMLQKMHVMTKLTVFIEAYKLGNVAALLDAPVFAQFKAHLQAADGEEEEFSSEDEDSLDEIEEELESEDDLEETLENAGASSYHDDDESEEQDGESAEAPHRLGAAHQDADGEWEDEEEYDDDEEEEFEDDDEEESDEEEEVSATGSSSGHDSEESGHHSSSHHEASDEEGEEHESSGHSGSSHSGKGHHFEDGTSISYKGEQHHSGSPSSWTHTEWDADTSSWPEFKKHLLDILVQLRNSIIHKMKQAQDDEVNAGIALADYQVIIFRENEDLAKALVNQQNRLEELTILQTKQQIRLTECQAELSTVTDSLYASRSEFDNSEAQYNENRKAAIEERDIYDYVVSMYEGQVEERFRFKGDNKRQLDNISF